MLDIRIVELVHERPLSILVAAEEPMRQHLVAMLLGGLRPGVREAQDSWDLVAQLLTVKQQVDLVVSDLRWLHGRALDLMDSLGAVGIDVPFLFIASNRTEATRVLSARPGVLVLESPVLASELLAGVRQLCRARGQSRGPGRSAA